MTVEIHASGAAAPDIVLAHAKAFADSVDTHPDYARVWLDWSTAMREEIWPLYLDFQENIVGIIAIRSAGGSASVGCPRRRADDDARLIRRNRRTWSRR